MIQIIIEQSKLRNEISLALSLGFFEAGHEVITTDGKIIRTDCDITILLNTFNKPFKPSIFREIKRKLFIYLEDLPTCERDKENFFKFWRHQRMLSFYSFFKPDLFTPTCFGIYDYKLLGIECEVLEDLFYQHEILQADLGWKRSGVAFFGGLTDRRAKIIVDSKIDIHNIVGWDQNRIIQLNRKKYCLNLLQTGEDDTIKIHRAVQAIMCGCLYISEPVPNSPLLDGEHCVMCDVGELPEVINYYENENGNGRALIENAQHLIMDRCSSINYARKVLEFFND